MKKILIISIMLLSVIMMQAQGTEPLTTKKGIPIIPESGTFALGIDATPFFRYAGNLFSGNNPFYPSFGFTAQTPGMIFGKYKASETTTYRAAVLIGYSSETLKSTNTTDNTAVDKATTSALTIGLYAGLEKHRNVVGRLSGYYGGQAGIQKDAYYNAAQGYYGKLSFKDGNDSNNDFVETGGSTYTLTAGGFAGLEFYVAPHIALMGEFGYYLSIFTQGKRTQKPASGSETIVDQGSSGFDFAPVASGNLILLFYF